MKYNFNQNVKDMEYFFSFCENMIECDLFNCNSENVITNKAYIFNKYGSFTKLNLFYINIQKVNDIFLRMFIQKRN